MFLKTLFYFCLLFGGGHFAKVSECNPPVEIMLQFLDASGKIPTGITAGNLQDLGAFDQCLALDETAEEIRFRGKYCLVQVPLPPDIFKPASKMSDSGTELQLPPELEDRAMLSMASGTVGLLLGWCIPDQCPIQNIITTLRGMITLGILAGQLPAQLKNITFEPFMGGMCQSQEDVDKESSTWTAADIGTVSFLGIVGAIMVLSTIYDMILRYTNNKPAHILLLAFSVRTNGEKLLAVSRNPDQLPCLHGIRCISMLWIIYGHRFTASFMEPVMNMNSIGELKNNAINMYIMAAPVSVDTFFFLSGMLVAYGFFLAKNKGVRFNIIMYWIHRYIRLTPALGVVLLVHATIINRFGSGPFWSIGMQYVKDLCVDNWWPNLLYIQNYYNPEALCLGQSWYLSIDTQLFFVAPFLLIPLWRWPKYTLIASVALLIGSMISPFVVSYHFDLNINIAETFANADYMPKYYYPTHTRFGPWLVGMMMGYYLFKLKTSKEAQIKPTALHVLGGWLVATVLSSTILFAQHNLIDEHERLANAFFNGMHRQAWCLALCWLIYACTQGYGGPVNTFLSWSPFQVLGRLTYTMYLTHLSMQYMLAASSRTNAYYTQFNNLYKFCGDFALTVFMSVCLSLSFESPMLVIEKVLFKTGISPKKSELPTHQTKTNAAVCEPTNTECAKS